MTQNLYLVQQFEEIFRVHFPTVKFFISKFLKSEADAEDLAQDVFVKLWANFELWKDNDGKDGYIYTIAKNLTLDFIKRKKLENDFHDEQVHKNSIQELSGFIDPLNTIYCDEIQLIMEMTLERFPERRRKIFKMSRLDNMSNQEIAKVLQISIRTVEHQIYLSLQILKKIIVFFLYFL